MEVKIRIDKNKLEALLHKSSIVEKDLEKRSERVLRRMKELAPKDTGDLARSLSIEKRVERGVIKFVIVSDDPQFDAIVHGTKGPYRAIPTYSSDTALGGWASRHSFTTGKSRYILARSIAIHGTKPAGTYEGRSNWIQEAIREAI